jgi:predicted TIM-barrel fold metal-dependent hydrolase
VRTYNVVSVDDHVSESPTTFIDRVPSAMKDRVPTTKKDASGITTYYVGDQPITWARHYLSDAEEGELRRSSDSLMITYANDPPGEWDAVARLRDYDLDGVDAGVLFHNFSGGGGNPLSAVTELDVRLECIKAVNDWVVEEYCAADPHRLFGLAVVPPWDIDLAKEEAIRAISLGHRGITWGPVMDAFGYKPTWDEYWDPLYAVLQEANIPLCIHVGFDPYRNVGIRQDLEKAPRFVTTAVQIFGTHTLMYPLVEILMSGLLERFPGLKVYFAEGGASWAPYTIQMCDHYWPRYIAFDRNILRMAPSDYARRQVSYGFFYDVITPTVVEALGENNVMWEADYCHTVTTFPNSRKYQEESLRTVTDERLRTKILAQNAVDLFHLG